MGADELDEDAPEHKRYMDDQPVFVAAEIENCRCGVANAYWSR
jgi:hypothetical protein